MIWKHLNEVVCKFSPHVYAHLSHDSHVTTGLLWFFAANANTWNKD